MRACFKPHIRPSCSFWLGLPPKMPPYSVAVLISAYRLFCPDNYPAFNRIFQYRRLPSAPTQNGPRFGSRLLVNFLKFHLSQNIPINIPNNPPRITGRAIMAHDISTASNICHRLRMPASEHVQAVIQSGIAMQAGCLRLRLCGGLIAGRTIEPVRPIHCRDIFPLF